jgi:hypothetical protein
MSLSARRPVNERAMLVGNISTEFPACILSLRLHELSKSFWETSRVGPEWIDAS